RLERVEAADDDALAPVVGLGDRRVLEDRTRGDELAVLHVDLGDLHRHAGAEARGETGADLEPEQTAAEQRVVVAVVGHDVGHHVDDGLGEPLGLALGAEDLADAVVAERRAEIVGQIVATDDDRVGLAAELRSKPAGLRDRAERVLVERALVVEHVNQDVAHASSFLSSSHATIFSTVSLVSSSSMISPAALDGGAWKLPHWTCEPSPPTFEVSMPTSPAAF